MRGISTTRGDPVRMAGKTPSCERKAVALYGIAGAVVYLVRDSAEASRLYTVCGRKILDIKLPATMSRMVASRRSL